MTVYVQFRGNDITYYVIEGIVFVQKYFNILSFSFQVGARGSQFSKLKKILICLGS